MKSVYLDNASTTRLDIRVLEAMMPYFTECHGNPSSLHSFGTRAKEALDTMRSKLAGFINAKPGEMIFTSGGTEANNLALKGTAFANRERGRHIIVSATEHDCILKACDWLANQGFSISYLPVNEDGLADIAVLRTMIKIPGTILVSVMHVNNETGAIQPIEEIGRICSEHQVPFHTDACQSFGKVPVDVVSDNISMMSLNAHKIYGPKGVGCLYVKEGLRLTPLFHGGGQELGIRSTTENIAGIAGFVKAAEICHNEMEQEYERLCNLRNTMLERMQSEFEGFYLNGDMAQCIPNIINFAISGLEGETMRLLLHLDERGIAVSAGSACSNNDSTKSASHVLSAMGRGQFEARGAVRVSPGRTTTAEDIHYFTEQFSDCIKKLNPIFS